MKLVDHLPERHRDTEVGRFQEGAEPALETLRAAVEDFLAQLWPSTATWGLEYWERALGLPVEVEKNTDWRRSSVIAKIRGGGATTAAAIQSIAESFSNGAADIIEYPNEFRFEVKFTGTVGTPPNMEDITNAIDEIKPAHLTYSYIIQWRTWGTVAQYTWGELADHTWADIKEGSF